MNKKKVKEFRLGNRRVSEQDPPFVMAEAGINHEGSFDKAIQLVDAALAAGADCIKFQCHITEAEMIPTDMKPGKISNERLWDIIKRCELNEDEERKLKAYCESKKIIYLCTPFSREASDRLEAMGILGFKIGSGECNNLPLIEHIAKKKKPIILSTGMNDIASIRPSVNAILAAGCPLILTHCTSMYPTPYDKVRLGGIQDLKRAFGVPVGLSDHSHGIYTCLGAVALDAVLLEKHFTISRAWPGPDNPISLEPNELKELVIGSRAVFQAAGGKKDILREEKPVIDFAYASVVAIDDIPKGAKFSPENLWVKRPGTGPIHAREFKSIIGKRAARPIAQHAQLKKADIAS